ncbi:MAG: outer membrane protein, partial [Gammaproteobacteria bacterium]
PYAGGGIGLTNVQMDLSIPNTFLVSDGEKLEDTVFSYQLFGGVRWMFTEHMNVFAQYNFLIADGLDDTAGQSTSADLGGGITRISSTTFNMDADLQMHSLRVGFGYQF